MHLNLLLLLYYKYCHFSYDAGYYGYIYSECYAADLFGVFEESTKDKEPIVNTSLGQMYRDAILARGATKSGFDMLTEFLGREPSKNTFFNRVKSSSN